MKAIAVIGAGYGDEGKGQMTNYFCQHVDNAVVMRYNGSCQAGHTVHHNSKRHIFSHFGSGSFVNTPTVLSEFFVNHPMLFKKEHVILNNTGIQNQVFVHPKSMVTTPFDMLVNQIVELGRGDKRHGSVGIGFSETFERNCYMPIYTDELFGDLDVLRGKLELIRDRWVPTRILERNDDNDHLYAVLKLEGIIDNFIRDVQHFTTHTNLYEYDMFKNYNIIFEGAQGLMLDQVHGFFPHVTRSNTGLKNIVEILNNYDNVESLDVHHITRSYSTRHGAGPFPFEEEFPEHIEDNTNHSHIFQGSLRYSPINYDELGKAISWDLESVSKIKIDLDDTDSPTSVDLGLGYEVNTFGVMTCMDQIPEEFPMIMDNERHVIDKDTFVTVVKQDFHYISNGPTKDHITKL